MQVKRAFEDACCFPPFTVNLGHGFGAYGVASVLAQRREREEMQIRNLSIYLNDGRQGLIRSDEGHDPSPLAQALIRSHS